MKKLILVLMLSTCFICQAKQSNELNILFVGNSIVYTNNLPAVTSTLLAAYTDKDIKVSMLASGGMTISEHFEKQELHSVIRDKTYDYVFLQERGGDLFCLLKVDFMDDPQCSKMLKSYDDLLSALRKSSKEIVILGTYQTHKGASEAIQKAEQKLGELLGIDALVVSNVISDRLNSALNENWLHSDGAHPGIEMTKYYATIISSKIVGRAVVFDKRECFAFPSFEPTGFSHYFLENGQLMERVDSTCQE
jgi:hypothetical protein